MGYGQHCNSHEGSNEDSTLVNATCSGSTYSLLPIEGLSRCDFELLSANGIARVFASQLDALSINFRDTLQNSYFTLNGNSIQFVWLQGYLTKIEKESGILSFDDGSRVLHIDFNDFRRSPLTQAAAKDLLKEHRYVAAICELSIVPVEDEAHPYFTLYRLSDIPHSDPNAETSWINQVTEWYLHSLSKKKASRANH